MKRNLQSTIKRYAVRLTLYVLIVIGACSCGWDDTDAISDKNGEVAVSVESSPLYTVEFVEESGEKINSNHYLIRRHGGVKAIVTTKGYEVTGTDCENAVVRTISDEKYEITINDVAYPTLLSLQLDSLYCDIKSADTMQYKTQFCDDGKTFDASEYRRIRKGTNVTMRVTTNGSVITGVEGYDDASVTQIDDTVFEVVVENVKSGCDFKFLYDEYIGVSVSDSNDYAVKFFDGVEYVDTNFFRAQKHQTVNIEVTPLKNFTLHSVNYQGATIEQTDGKYYVTLPDIKELTRLTFDIELSYVNFSVAQNRDYTATVYYENGDIITDGKVVKGSNVIVKCVTKTGLTISYVSNSTAEIKHTASNEFTITLSGIIDDVELNIACENSFNTVRYYPNGGVLKNGKKDCFMRYDVMYHLRPNTSIGTDIMERDGYTLTGWNTLPDGSGEHIGLGSRVTVGDDTVDLYAEWSKWTDGNAFVTSISLDGTATVLSYTDDGKSTVTVPEYVVESGMRYVVTAIADGAFRNVGANTVILPKTLQTVEEGAFENCEFSDLYFFDNIDGIADGCFENCNNFSTVHVNAIIPPRYADYDRHSTYADKIDRLILNKDNKKIVVFGGSGAFYSVSAELLESKRDDYVAVNVALNGWFNAQLQMEVVMRYMGEGDVFLHVPESCAKHQLMIENSMGTIGGEQEDLRLFKCLELNWDLLSMVDLRHVTKTFDCFYEYNRVRKLLPAESYEAYTDYMNEWGDYKMERNSIPPTNGAISHESEINVTMFDYNAKYKLNAYYEALENKGCMVAIAFACMNASALTDEQRDLWLEYQSKLIDYVSGRVIDDFYEVMYPVEYFCDSDWHLTYDKSLVNTELLFEYLKDYL